MIPDMSNWWWHPTPEGFEVGPWREACAEVCELLGEDTSWLIHHEDLNRAIAVAVGPPGWMRPARRRAARGRRPQHSRSSRAGPTHPGSRRSGAPTCGRWHREGASFDTSGGSYASGLIRIRSPE